MALETIIAYCAGFIVSCIALGVAARSADRFREQCRENWALDHSRQKLQISYDVLETRFRKLQAEHAALLEAPSVRERERQAEILDRKHELELAHIGQQLLEAQQKKDATEHFKERKTRLGEARFDKRIADDQLDAAAVSQAVVIAQPEQPPDPIAQLSVEAAALIEMVQQRQADGEDTPALNAAAESARAFMQALATMEARP